MYACIKFYTSAVGQTVGAFHRRDGRGDDAEILVARLIDRPIRPMITEVRTDTLTKNHFAINHPDIIHRVAVTVIQNIFRDGSTIPRYWHGFCPTIKFIPVKHSPFAQPQLLCISVR